MIEFAAYHPRVGSTMPAYIVRVTKSELVMLECQIPIEAESQEAACAKMRHRLLRGYEISDTAWYEVDSSSLPEKTKVEDSRLDRG